MTFKGFERQFVIALINARAVLANSTIKSVGLIVKLC